MMKNKNSRHLPPVFPGSVDKSSSSQSGSRYQSQPQTPCFGLCFESSVLSFSTGTQHSLSVFLCFPTFISDVQRRGITFYMAGAGFL